MVAFDQSHIRPSDQGARPAAQRLFRQPVEGTLDRLESSGLHQLRAVCCQKLSYLTGGSGLGEMVHSKIPSFVASKVSRTLPVQALDLIAAQIGREPALKETSKQWVQSVFFI
jgi:hypothetical protein